MVRSFKREELLCRSGQCENGSMNEKTKWTEIQGHKVSDSVVLPQIERIETLKRRQGSHHSRPTVQPQLIAPVARSSA